MAETARQVLPSEVLKSLKPWFTGVGAFSAGVNLLMLTGALYMLQVYDRVLMSKSIPTLVALSVLTLLAFLLQGFLDSIRMRMLLHIGSTYEQKLAAGVFDAVAANHLAGKTHTDANQPARDLERVRGFLASLGPTAILDMPFMPLFLASCYVLHFWLGTLALLGGVAIILMTVYAEYAAKHTMSEANTRANDRISLLEALSRNCEAITAMGFRPQIRARWERASEAASTQSVATTTSNMTTGAWAKTLRLGLQSAMLGLGGYLAIHNEVSAGAIIAGSILMSRALAPIEIAIGYWRQFAAARQSHANLERQLKSASARRGTTSLPRPRASLSVENLVVAAPGQSRPVVADVSFSLAAGSAIAVFGPSAAGKSSLARAMVGLWPAAHGHVRLDGAAIAQFPEDEIGRYVGYLPQDVELLDGTVGENIARFDPEAKDAEIVAAAKKAGAHDLILRLPNGYDTHIGEGGTRLSGGQRQRIALARAMFRDPFLVVLDEPNSNLDGSGDQALNEAILSVRQRGGIVVVISHRTATIAAVDHIAIMNDGQLEEFGSREQMMPKLVRSKDAPAPRVGAEGTARNAGPVSARQVASQ